MSEISTNLILTKCYESNDREEIRKYLIELFHEREPYFYVSLEGNKSIRKTKEEIVNYLDSELSKLFLLDRETRIKKEEILLIWEEVVDSNSPRKYLQGDFLDKKNKSIQIKYKKKKDTIEIPREELENFKKLLQETLNRLIILEAKLRSLY